MSGRIVQLKDKNGENIFPISYRSASGKQLGVPENVAYLAETDGEEIAPSLADISVYTAGETRVGVWIDRKPIYRRVVQAPTTGWSNNRLTVSTGLANVVDTMVTLTGTFTTSNNLVGSLSMALPGWQIMAYDFYKGNGNVSLFADTNHINRGFKNIYLILEYTKQ